MTEKLSALMDGELDETEAVAAFARLRTSEDYRQHWNDCHLIGDALRGAARLDVDLTARIMEALVDEPVVLAPPPKRPGTRMQRSLALAASVAGISMVAMMAWNGRPVPSVSVASVPADAQVPAQLAKAKLDSLQAYLVAHQTHAPSAQGAAHYIKTVSMETGGH